MTLTKKVTALLLALALSTAVAGAAVRFGIGLSGLEQRWGGAATAALALGLTALSGAGLAVAAAIALDRLALGRLRDLSDAARSRAEASADDAALPAHDGWAREAGAHETGTHATGTHEAGADDAEDDDAPIDEIDALERSLASLGSQLEAARRPLADAARKVGASEIATGILHNVGNVLNSVNISTSLVSQRVDGLSVEDLERLAAAIRDHKDDLAAFLTQDPRGQHIEPFLSALVTQLGEEQQAIRSEIDSLAEGIEHICELVKSQQRFAKGAALPEPTDLAERFDDALRITQRVHGVDESLVVIRRFEDVGAVRVDRHRLLEILVNLLQNARQAMARSDGPRELTLEIESSDGDRVRLAVADTGVGIEADNLERIFQMGFTTREDGHGFGLHSSATAARELGGELLAESDGEGRGARFVLHLPTAPPGSETELETPGDLAMGGAA